MSSYLSAINARIQTTTSVVITSISNNITPEFTASVITSIALKYICNFSNKFSCLFGGTVFIVSRIIKNKIEKNRFEKQTSKAQLLKTFLSYDKPSIDSFLSSSEPNNFNQQFFGICEFFKIEIQTLLNIWERHPSSFQDRMNLFFDTLPKNKKSIFE